MSVLTFQFETDLIGSITKGKFYAQVIKKPLSYSIKFFLLFSLFYTISATLVIWLKYIYPATPVIQKLPDYFVQVYPQDLVITIREGKVSTNVDEPYFIPVNKLRQVIYQIRNDILGTNTETMDYLMVIDTQADIDTIYQYRTFSLLNADHLVYLHNNNPANAPEIRAVKINPHNNLIINQDYINRIAQSLTPFAKQIPLYLILGSILVLTIILPPLRLIHVFFITLPIWLISRVIYPKISFKQNYQLCLHAYIAITSIISIIFIAASEYYQLPYTVSILTLISAVIVLTYLKNHPNMTRKKPPKST